MTRAVELAQIASAGVSEAFKNRIINGGMVIDQRNAGASITPTDGQFSVDRWKCVLTQTSKYSAQQNAGSVTPPAGFTNYLGVTSLSAYSLVAGDYFVLRHPIEGFNTADLGWGTANAQTVTLSFWVRSSLTGTFGGSIFNSALNRTYVFSYTISAPNTWEQKSVTITGDTTGTWLTNNGIGISVDFTLASGSNFTRSAGSWSTSGFAATGTTSVVGTNGATFYITGVQFEVGSSATSFETRAYSTELALCQRYYEKSFDISAAPANNISSLESGNFVGFYSSGGRSGAIYYKVTKRADATITFFKGTTAASNNQWSYYDYSNWQSFTETGTGASKPHGFYMYGIKSASFTNGASYLLDGNWTASAEL